MIKQGKIQPTSVHKSKDEAETAAKARSASMANGGLLEEYYGKSQLQYQQAVKDGFQGTYEEYL